MHYLPEEILVEILVRLSPKSITRLKLVSKSWLSLINSNSFIQSHLNFINTRKSSAKIIYGSGWVDVYCGGPIGTWLWCDKQITQLDWTTHIVDHPHKYCFSLISCAVHGIYCVKFMPNDIDLSFGTFPSTDIALWNPAISQIHVLPRITRPTLVDESKYKEDTWSGYIELCGFGFDSSTNDYKIITVTDYRYRSLFHNDIVRGSWFHIYSHATNTWKQLDPFKISAECPSIIDVSHDNKIVSFTGNCRPSNGFYFNGPCHWVYNYFRCEEKHILFFNFRDEMFGVYRIPKAICYEENVLVTEMNGCLAVVCKIKNTNHDRQWETWWLRYEIWMMREYGMDSCWSKFYKIPIYSRNNFVGIVNDEQFFVMEGNRRLISYNLHAPKKKKTSYVHRYFRELLGISSYRESLIPVKPHAM